MSDESTRRWCSDGDGRKEGGRGFTFRRQINLGRE